MGNENVNIVNNQMFVFLLRYMLLQRGKIISLLIHNSTCVVFCCYTVVTMKETLEFEVKQ